MCLGELTDLGPVAARDEDKVLVKRFDLDVRAQSRIGANDLRFLYRNLDCLYRW